MSVNILIAFYSRSGTTEVLANAIADGVKQVGGNVRLRRAREIVPLNVMQQVPGWAEAATEMNSRYEAPCEEDATWAHGIIMGSPTRFGSAASELKAYIDSLGGLWMRGLLNGKVGSAFSSSGSRHGGNETAILSLYPPMAHLGLIIIPTGYADASLFKAGTPYGASAVSPINSPGSLSQEDIDVARFQGERVAQTARRLLG